MTAAQPEFSIRPYQQRDLDALYDICLRTGDHGRDASALHRDPLLLGHRWAAPYAALEPELTFVLEDAGGVCGYVLGTRDTERFVARLESEWLPPLRARYPAPQGDPATPDERLIRQLHETPTVLEVARAYPAHLHIDLLPRAQGRGWGRPLMDTFLAALRARGVSGVHLGTSEANARACRFYARCGFREYARGGGGVTFVMALEAEGMHHGARAPKEP